MTAAKGVLPLQVDNEQGTVTSVSVVSANGFAGSVATATTTPAITVSTTVTGVLKGNGTAISAALNSDLPTMTATVGGAVPTPPNNTTTFLRGDGTFAAPAAGTVTHTAGALTANQLVIGNATDDIKVLGTLGTTTTVLHGNAGGAPTFGAVSLTADVSGILPGANGGTGNGFTAISGPTTSLKTFALPDASATILTTNAAVTVAQGGTGAATFTDGGVLIGNGTGAVQVTSAGTAGQVLTSNGAGVDPTFQAAAGGGGWTLITASTVVASGAATMDIEWATTAYDQFAIVLSGITCVTDAVNILIRFKVGGAYDSGSNYLYSMMNIDSGNSGFFGNSTAGVAAANGLLGAAMGNAAGRGGDWIIYIHNPQSTSLEKRVTITGNYIRSNGNVTSSFGFAQNSSTSAMTGLRLLMSSGNLSGTGRLYGIQNS